ncbi:unnamed protein product [Arctia plantaginis]|uniref:Arrestin C-terminal-like domain-containing protein n=1 Tax=Arctia plantaginis TaxID=874455 RepID=A0A8S0ZVG9_ARCPL|nr:unnamed protein product [Arctia plantaginis]
MWIECCILLPPIPGGAYRSCQTVTGMLKYSLKQPTEFTSATIELKGKGKCSWAESDSDSASCYGKEEYVFLVRNILKRNKNKLPAGHYNYPFKFVLPPGLPSWFKEHTGKISYKIIARFSKPGFLDNKKEFETEIRVYGDLEPCLKEPVIFGLTKTSLTSSGAIDLKAEIMKTLLVAGEHIKVECSIVNNTSIPVTDIRLKLFSETTYTSNSKRKHQRRNSIKGSATDRVGPKTNRVKKILCIVPTSPDLYSIQRSEIIKREYKLQVTAVVPFPHRNASVEIPVVISK